MVNTEHFEADFPDGDQLGSPVNVARSNWVVMKFGGTSVSVAENWSTIADLVRNRLADGLQLLIVHSALKGVSNAQSAGDRYLTCQYRFLKIWDGEYRALRSRLSGR